MNALHAPLFQSGQIAAVLDIEPRTIESWVSRRVFQLAGSDLAAVGHGHYRKFSRRTAHRIAIIAELVKVGLSPAKAAISAKAFSDRGEHGREPGRLYPNDKTFLLISPAGARVINAASVLSLEDLAAATGERSSVFVALDCTRLLNEIDSNLTHKEPK